MLASGPRTNPWFQEASMRPVEAGDMLSFDTDMVGPYGYCCDISRSWVCGTPPDDEQRLLYAAAYEQIVRNTTQRELDLIIKLGYALGAVVGAVAYVVSIALPAVQQEGGGTE